MPDLIRVWTASTAARRYWPTWKKRAAGQNRALYPRRRPLPALPDRHRADRQQAVVRQNCSPWPKPAIEAVIDGRITIIPERFTKVYLNWMENIRDWCISRQLWWGHRIPVWYCRDCGEMTVAVEDAKCLSATAAQQISSRTRMCWIPGSVRRCGRTPPWAGPMIPKTCAISTPPPSWRPAMISSSSGSPA